MVRRSRSLVMLLGFLAASACSSDGGPGASTGGSAGSSAGSGGSGGTSVTGGSGGTGGATGGSGGTGQGGTGTGGSATGGTAGTGGTGGAAGGGTGGTGGAGGTVSRADGGGQGGNVDAGGPRPPADSGARDTGTTPRVDSAAVDPGTEGDGDINLTTFTTQPDLTNRNAPRGRSFNFTMDSTKSVIFDGTDTGLQAAKPRLLTRRIDVYIPAQYKDGTPAPIIVIQDGPGQLTPMSYAVDNLSISTNPARKLPPIVLIGVQNGGNDGPGSERGLEYDTVSDRYARFIQTEVLPAVVSNAAIKAAYPNFAITSDPEGRGTYGCSSGGEAAFTMGWFRPEWFRRLITYSGTFVSLQTSGQPENQLYPLGSWEYHSSKMLIAAAEPKPLRVFINANAMDNGYNTPESGHRNWLIANQQMAAAFKAKNYHYRYVFGGAPLGHCDARAWQSTLADTLVWAWAGYPTN